jgi:hypothetical protein
MSAPATAATQFDWPADVLDFATQQHVGAYLEPLLEATQRIFPTAQRTNVALERDPEIPDDCHITFEVRVPGVSPSDAAEGRNRWIRELFSFCPTPLTCVFRLFLELGES